MAKKKRPRRTLPNGHSAPKGERGTYLPYEMITSKQFRKLSGSATKVLLELCTWHNGFNNGKIVCSYKQLADNLGLGKTTIGVGVICLLTHPEKSGFVKVGIELGTWAEVCEKWPWGDWEYHRYRHIEELRLAETLIWELLNQPLPYTPEPIQLDLKVAEEAFRKLHGALQEEIAFEERRKENIQNGNLK